MRSRRRAREFALQMLYQWDLRGGAPREVLETFWVGIDVVLDVQSYAERLFRGTLQQRAELDRLIEHFSHRWRLSRMAIVDRNILRLGAFELLHEEDVPISVILNEAIEIAKHYSGNESGAFINGILDKIAQEAPQRMELPETEGARRNADEEDEEFMFDDE